MVQQLSNFETDCLLKAVHHYVMYLRELSATASEEYVNISSLEKFLLDSDSIELSNNLPF